MSVDLGPGSNWTDFCCVGWKHPDMLVVPAFILWGMSPGSGSFYISVPECILFYCYSLILESEKNPPVLPTFAFGAFRHSRDHSVLSSLADQNLPKKRDQKTWGLNIFDWFPLSFGPNWWQRLKSMLWNCRCYGPFSWQQGGSYDGCKSTHDAPTHPPTVDASELETNFFKEMFLHFSFWLILSHWFVWSFLLNPRRCRSNIYIAAPQMSPGGDGEPGD